MTNLLRISCFALALLPAIGDAAREPVIDMHLHASAANSNGPPPLAICIPVWEHLPTHDPARPWAEVFIEALKNPTCAEPIWSPETDDALMRETISEMERLNVVGLLSGEPKRVLQWHRAAPGRFIPSIQLRIGRDPYDADELRKLYSEGPFVSLGEISNQYAGIAPDDPRMEPFWKMAEEMDIPVGIHMGEGPPGGGYLFPEYDLAAGNPLLLDSVLSRHPKLRIWVMHYGSPLVDEMIALMANYSNVYIDISSNQWAYPRAYFYRHLRQFVEAGMGKRVMFGSDQMNWPGLIEPSIAIIKEAPFLNEQQKRDILYENAARFLRLSDEEKARHLEQ